MGKVKESKAKVRKILKTMIHLKNIDSDLDMRVEAFQIDLENILETKNKKEKLFKLRRLNDELCGFYIRIYQTVLTSKNIFSSSTQIKELKKLGELCNAYDSVSQLNDLLEKLKGRRDKSAHPHSYFVNDTLLNYQTDIHKAVKTSRELLNSLNIADEFSLLREEKEQENFLIQKFSKTRKKEAEELVLLLEVR